MIVALSQIQMMGLTVFNIFGFIDGHKKPIYFEYIRIIQLILSGIIRYSQIENIMSEFASSKEDCKEAINKLISSGAITQIFSHMFSDYTYKVSEKGKFMLEMFCNDIHFLYYAALDTFLPESLIKGMEFSSNNPEYNPDITRPSINFYPISALITGTIFRQYIEQINNKEINRPIITKTLEKFNRDVEIFRLHKRPILHDSIKKMVEACDKNEKYKKRLIQWQI